MDYLKKLTELADNNPDFRKTLEDAFPEIIVDEEPYIFKGDFFLRRDCNKNIYRLDDLNLAVSRVVFRIKNITTDKLWNHNIDSDGFALRTYKSDKSGEYLTKTSFIKLLKASGVKLDSIRILDASDFVHFHNIIFNKK